MQILQQDQIGAQLDQVCVRGVRATAIRLQLYRHMLTTAHAQNIVRLTAQWAQRGDEGASLSIGIAIDNSAARQRASCAVQHGQKEERS
jgi:hypothetical protein